MKGGAAHALRPLDSTSRPASASLAPSPRPPSLVLDPRPLPIYEGPVYKSGMAGRHEAHFFDAIEAAFDMGVGGGVGEDRWGRGGGEW